MEYFKLRADGSGTGDMRAYFPGKYFDYLPKK
jgi:hypothetical protein